MSEDLRLHKSVVVYENGSQYLRCHLESFDFPLWDWVASIINEKFPSTEAIQPVFHGLEALKPAKIFVITEAQLKTIWPNPDLLPPLLTDLPIDEDGCRIVSEEDFIPEKAEELEDLTLLRFFAAELPEYGKKSLKIVTNTAKIVVQAESAIVMNFLKSHAPFLVSTHQLAGILREWHQFLLKYETGGIPGLQPQSTSHRT